MISQEAMQRMTSKVQERVKATPPGTWGKVGVGVLVGGVAIGWLAFPYVLDKVVASQINLSQGKDSRRLWIQLPAFDCNIYVFNITNPAAVMNGARPELQEVGPYCYKEVKDKTDLVEDPATDTISYSARSTWYPNQQGPNCPAPHLTGDELLVVPNIPILAILLIAEKDFPTPFMTLVNQALPNIFGKFNDLFMRVSAKTLLFGGIPINCSANALYPRAVCIALKQNSRALKKLGNNQYTFSFFGAKNNTAEEFRLTVRRGAVEGQEIGRLVGMAGRPELPFWRGECNKLQGTDSTVFPPFRQKENGSLVAYSSEYCRIFLGTYDGVVYYNGVEGYSYRISLGDSETNLADRCYCPADDRCRKTGVLDALKCQGAPLVASLPHFFQASPDYINGVVGLQPDQDKHGIQVVLEPISGTPLIVRKRIQFNIDFKPIRYVPLTQKLRRTLLPLFWAEERLDLDGDLMGLLEASLFRPIRAVDVIKWLAITMGVGLGVTAAVLKYRNSRRDKVHVLNSEALREENGTSEVVKNGFEPQKSVDPYLIKTKESSNDQNGNFVGLSASRLITAPTKTSANGVRQIPADQPYVRPDSVNLDNQTEFYNNSDPFVPQHDSVAREAELPSSKPHSATFKLSNYTKIDDAVDKDELIKNAREVELPSSKPHSATFKLSNDIKSDDTEDKVELIKNQSQSSNPKINDNTTTFSIIQTKTLHADDSLNRDETISAPLIESLQPSSSAVDQATSLHGQEMSEQNNSSELNFSTSIENTAVTFVEDGSKLPFDESKLFGNEMRSEEGAIDSKNEIGRVGVQPENPTEEEIKAVEDDINKLMAEMATLIPKKLYNRDN